MILYSEYSVKRGQSRPLFEHMASRLQRKRKIVGVPRYGGGTRKPKSKDTESRSFPDWTDYVIFLQSKEINAATKRQLGNGSHWGNARILRVEGTPYSRNKKETDTQKEKTTNDRDRRPPRARLSAPKWQSEKREKTEKRQTGRSPHSHSAAQQGFSFATIRMGIEGRVFE